MKKQVFLINFLVSAFLIHGAFVQAKTPSCADYLSIDFLENNSELTVTAKLISYLGSLYEQNIIGVEELTLLVKNIEQTAQLINIVALPEVKSSHRVHYEMMGDYLAQQDLDIKAIHQWAQDLLKSKNRAASERKHVDQDTRIAKTPMQFRPVKAGSFKLTEFGSSYPVTLTHNISVMDTPVTQWMWVAETNENPSRYVDGPEATTIEMGGKKLKLQYNNPVENITWYSAVAFANHMSRKQGLPEVYDFSGVKFKPSTRMEDGTLDLESGEVKIYGGNIYEAEGFRLPTSTEQRYMATNCGTSKTNYFSDVNDGNLDYYVWYRNNANRQTHPVAYKRPFIIDGEEFYDLLGNVFEWSHNWHAHHSEREKVNPQGPSQATDKSMHGGGCDSTTACLCSQHVSLENPSTRVHYLGFRLVRTVYKWKTQ